MTKFCKKCNTTKDIEEFWFSNKATGTRAGYCKPCWSLYVHKYEKTCKRKRTATQYYRDLKEIVIAGYGGKCACCGEPEHAFLTLDHVNGGGLDHRKLKGAHAAYRDAQLRNFPLDYQVLCFNCNCCKAHLGYCAHHADKSNCAVHWMDRPALPGVAVMSKLMYKGGGRPARVDWDSLEQSQVSAKTA